MGWAESAGEAGSADVYQRPLNEHEVGPVLARALVGEIDPGPLPVAPRRQDVLEPRPLALGSVTCAPTVQVASLGLAVAQDANGVT